MGIHCWFASTKKWLVYLGDVCDGKRAPYEGMNIMKMNETEMFLNLSGLKQLDWRKKVVQERKSREIVWHAYKKFGH